MEIFRCCIFQNFTIWGFRFLSFCTIWFGYICMANYWKLFIELISNQEKYQLPWYITSTYTDSGYRNVAKSMVSDYWLCWYVWTFIEYFVSVCIQRIPLLQNYFLIHRRSSKRHNCMMYITTFYNNPLQNILEKL